MIGGNSQRSNGAAIRAAWPVAPVQTWWREAVGACGPFEWVMVGYLALVNLLIVAFRHNLPRAELFLAGHWALAGAIVLLAWAAARWPHPALRFVRCWYPLAMFLFCFEELHYLVHLIHAGWLDHWLIRFDYALLGMHPTVWLQQFASPALNELMQASYMTYYFYTVVLCGALYLHGEWPAFWRVMTASAAAYTTGYVISIVFPIESPYHALAALHTVELHGGFFASLIEWIERYGRVHGAAFPSAHVSGATVAMLGAWHYRRRMFAAFLPFYLLMLVSTVYGRYHYVADVLAGLAVAWMGWRLVAGREEKNEVRK